MQTHTTRRAAGLGWGRGRVCAKGHGGTLGADGRKHLAAAGIADGIYLCADHATSSSPVSVQPKAQTAKALEGMLVKAVKAACLSPAKLAALRSQVEGLHVALPNARRVLGAAK
jgi:hypothetical protein